MTTHDLPRFLLCVALAGLAAGAAAQTHPPLTAAPAAPASPAPAAERPVVRQVAAPAAPAAAAAAADEDAVGAACWPRRPTAGAPGRACRCRAGGQRRVAALPGEFQPAHSPVVRRAHRGQRRWLGRRRGLRRLCP
ncbi:hypothetical protein FC419_09165 [Bordetella pertussis]